MFASELVPVYDGDGKQYSDWRILRDGVDVTSSVQQPTWANANKCWGVSYGSSSIYVPGTKDDLSLSWEMSHPYEGVHQYTATRIESNFKGYSLAGQSDKLIAPSTGIRRNWLSDDVQTSLERADAEHTAIESLASSVDSKADKTALALKADKTELADKADKATTLDGYGITDAATKTELETLAARVDAANIALEEIA